MPGRGRATRRTSSSTRARSRTGWCATPAIVGHENVIAGTDCGIGTRVGHAEIAWAKLQSLVDGARIATKELWGR